MNDFATMSENIYYICISKMFCSIWNVKPQHLSDCTKSYNVVHL